MTTNTSNEQTFKLSCVCFLLFLVVSWCFLLFLVVCVFHSLSVLYIFLSMPTISIFKIEDDALLEYLYDLFDHDSAGVMQAVHAISGHPSYTLEQVRNANCAQFQHQFECEVAVNFEVISHFNERCRRNNRNSICLVHGGVGRDFCFLAHVQYPESL